VTVAKVLGAENILYQFQHESYNWQDFIKLFFRSIIELYQTECFANAWQKRIIFSILCTMPYKFHCLLNLGVLRRVYLFTSFLHANVE